MTKTKQPRFIKLDDKGAKLPARTAAWAAVLDSTTGLIWTRDTLPCGSVPWKRAIAEAKKVRLCSAKDWRLPTRAQLLTLVDDTRHDPAIDVKFFPDTKSNWYWSATPYASSPAVYAWFVYFNGGSANWYLQSDGGFVRAVRASQSLDIGAAS